MRPLDWLLCECVGGDGCGGVWLHQAVAWQVWSGSYPFWGWRLFFSFWRFSPAHPPTHTPSRLHSTQPTQPTNQPHAAPPSLPLTHSLLPRSLHPSSTHESIALKRDRCCLSVWSCVWMARLRKAAEVVGVVGLVGSSEERDGRWKSPSLQRPAAPS